MQGLDEDELEKIEEERRKWDTHGYPDEEKAKYVQVQMEFSY